MTSTAEATARLDRVAEIIVRTAKTEILPRWRNLSSQQIREKNPGDIVTEADEAAERALAAALTSAFPGSMAIGEEAVAHDPSVLDALTGDKPVWVADPIDGTAAFAAGHERFTVIVSLIERGETQAAWIYAPTSEDMIMAAPGLATTINNAPAAMGRADIAQARVLALNPVFMSAQGRSGLRQLTLSAASVAISIGIGADIMDVVRGRADAAVFTTRKPWEMPAAKLLIEAAGGTVCDSHGDAFAPLDQPQRPLVAATSADLAKTIAHVFAAQAKTEA